MDYSSSEAHYIKHFEPLAKARGQSLPPFSEAIHNISILFVNSHETLAPALSLPPNAVNIGGYHIAEEVPPLPQGLQKLLDSSKDGFVYFSMGSVVKSKALPEKTKRELINVFANTPYTVLWKFEETMDNLPQNLHIRAWMPQSSILAHPNIKVFITHGGLLSITESMRFGVPLVVVPVFGDQPSNADRVVNAGHGLKVPFSTDMAPKLAVALKEMLSNDSYYKQAKFWSRWFNDRPVSPQKLIQYYVKLAIESKGAYHIRSKTHLYKWYELWMLDQVAVLLLILITLYISVKKIFRYLTVFGADNKEKKL